MAIVQKSRPNDPIDLHVSEKLVRKKALRLLPKYSCIFCDDSFFKKNDYRKHIREHARNLTLRCPCCNQEYEDKKVILEHLITKGENSLECQMCEFKGIDEMEMEKHTSTHILFYQPLLCLTKPLSTCMDCNFQTPDQNKMFIHRYKKHINAIPVRQPVEKVCRKSCKDCGETFSSQHFLNRHRKIHNIGKLLYACSYCEYRSDFPRAIEIHLKKKHDLSKTMFKCALCDHHVPKISLLKKHITLEQHVIK